MSGLSNMQKAGNLFGVTNDLGHGLCALGDVMKAADMDRLDEYTLNGLGFLISALGVALLETADHGRKIASAPPG